MIQQIKMTSQKSSAYTIENFPGEFIRESFSLRRNQSICSVHGISRVSSRQESLDCQNFGKKPEKHTDNERSNKSFHHYRYVIVTLGGFAVGFMSLLRLTVTVAILNMVNQTQIYIEENPGADLVEYFGEGYVEVGEFEWTNEIQQLIISYYMITYTLPQLFTTKLAIKMGVRWSIPLSVGICALSCLLTPIMAYYGWQHVMILRLFNGLGASAILPLMVYLIELWMPTSESSTGLAIVQTIQSILFTISPLVGGALADIHWKWSFYVPAIISLVFCLIWIFLVSDQPSNNKFISQAELDLICGCEWINNQLDARNHHHDHHHHHSHDCDEKNGHNVKAPENSYSEKVNDQVVVTTNEISWTRVLRLKSFYALAAVWILYQNSFGSLSFLLPIYMRQVLKVPIVENGMLCFVIQAGCMISVIWPQPFLRLLQNTFNLSLTSSRRLVMAFICIVAITTYLLVAKYHQYQVLLFSINRIIHLSTDTIVTSTVMSQYAHAGLSSIVFSLINSVGNFCTVFFCMAVGKFLDISGQSPECWSWVFVAMSVMTLFVLIVYSTAITSKPVELDVSQKEEKFNTKTDLEKC